MSTASGWYCGRFIFSSRKRRPSDAQSRTQSSASGSSSSVGMPKSIRCKGSSPFQTVSNGRVSRRRVRRLPDPPAAPPQKSYSCSVPPDGRAPQTNGVRRQESPRCGCGAGERQQRLGPRLGPEGGRGRLARCGGARGLGHDRQGRPPRAQPCAAGGVHRQQQRVGGSRRTASRRMSSSTASAARRTRASVKPAERQRATSAERLSASAAARTIRSPSPPPVP